MNKAKLTRLPLDFKGNKLSNRIEDEERPLVTIANKPYRAVMLMFGAFYTNSLELRDATGRLLESKTDYETVYIYENLVGLSGKEVMGWINVKDPTAVSPVKATYQAVGGNFALSYKELVEIFKQLDQDNTEFKFEDIIGLPEAFPPTDHMHEIWQLIGLDTTVIELQRIAGAIPFGMDAIIESSDEYAQGYVDLAKQAVEAYRLKVMKHINDEANPHVTQPRHVQRELLHNWGLSTQEQAKDPSNNNTYLPIGHVQTILGNSLLPLLDAHIKNTNNPHGTTSEDVGSYTKPVVDNAYIQKLRWDQSAFDSSAVGSTSFDSFNYLVKTNIPSANITTGVFPQTQVGGAVPGDPNLFVLTGNGIWTLWTDILKTYNSIRGRIIQIGQHRDVFAAVNWANTTIPNMDEGTTGIGFQYVDASGAVTYVPLIIEKKNGTWQPKSY